MDEKRTDQIEERARAMTSEPLRLPPEDEREPHHWHQVPLSGPDVVFMAHARQDTLDLVAEVRAGWRRDAEHLAARARTAQALDRVLAATIGKNPPSLAGHDAAQPELVYAEAAVAEVERLRARVAQLEGREPPAERETVLARWRSWGNFRYAAEVLVRLRDPHEGENVAWYPLAIRVASPSGSAELPMTIEQAEELGRELLRLAQNVESPRPLGVAPVAPRAGKVAAAVEQVHESVLAMREVISQLAIAAGHAPADLSWEERSSPEQRWDLVHRDGRWLGGVVVHSDGRAIHVTRADAPPATT